MAVVGGVAPVGGIGSAGGMVRAGCISSPGRMASVGVVGGRGGVAPVGGIGSAGRMAPMGWISGFGRVGRRLMIRAVVSIVTVVGRHAPEVPQLAVGRQRFDRRSWPDGLPGHGPGLIKAPSDRTVAVNGGRDERGATHLAPEVVPGMTIAEARDGGERQAVHVRLEPVGPAGGRARLGSRLLALLPFALLGVVVLLAVAAGPGGFIVTPAATSEATEPAVAAMLPADGAAAATNHPVPSPDRRIPRFAWDLPVRSLAGLLAERAAGSIHGELVAVSGLVSYDPRGARCPDDNPNVTTVFCQRTARLAAAPAIETGVAGPDAWTDTTLGAALSPPGRLVLEARVPPGVPMPAMFAADPPPTAPGEPLVSVLIGRFTNPVSPTCDGSSACDDEFVLERLAWAAGTWIDRILVRDADVPESAVPTNGIRSMAIARRESDRLEQILSLAVLQQRSLASIDPAIGREAAGGAAANNLPAGAVWYVRSAGRQVPGIGRQLTWAVIDDPSGFILATGAIGRG